MSEKIISKVRGREWPLNLILLASTIVAFCVCLESGARIYLCHFASDAIFLRYASLSQLEDRVSQGRSAFVKKTFHRYLGYNLTPNFRSGLNRHNSLGYRGDEIEIPKPADEFRIVCLGGSTTYTSGVADYRLSYPELLEHDLQQRGYQKVNVINAGVPGWTTWECLINFQFRILDMQPDMIIVYEAINDIHTRLVWPPAAYQGDNSGTSIPAVSSIFMPSIFEYSTVIRFFLVRAGVTQPHADITKTIDRRAPTFYADNFQRQKIQQTYPSGVFKKTSAQQMLETNKPVYYRRNIENILLIARARAITPVVATFAYSPLFENEPRVASPEYIFAYEEMNELLKSIATESVANLFDFGSKFPTDKKYYHDGRHVNEEGARLMAKMFADYLVESHLLPGTLLRRDIISTQHLN